MHPNASTPRGPAATSRTRRKVLALINLALHAAGAPAIDHLPKGQLSSPTDCPLARALSPAGVVSAGWSWERPHLSVRVAEVLTPAQAERLRLAWHMEAAVPGGARAGLSRGWAVLPPALHQFIVSFDSRRYPDLIEWVIKCVIQADGTV